MDKLYRMSGLRLLVLGLLLCGAAGGARCAAEVGAVVAPLRVELAYDAAGNRVLRRTMPAVADGSDGAGTGGVVTVSPTVTDGSVTLRTTADLSRGGAGYVVSSLDGSVTASGSITAPTVQVAIPGAAGVYLLSVTAPDVRKTVKIIKK